MREGKGGQEEKGWTHIKKGEGAPRKGGNLLDHETKHFAIALRCKITRTLREAR
jgi:hypothetical protein